MGYNLFILRFNVPHAAEQTKTSHYLIYSLVKCWSLVSAKKDLAFNLIACEIY